MFNIKLYQFSKRRNSTEVVTDDYLIYEFQCDTMANFDLVHPVFPINQPASEDLTYLTYIGVPAWNRYYFVDNWNYDAGIWYASCTEDVLASWKGHIGANTVYVLRSASDYDVSIPDHTYPAKSNVTKTVTEASNPWNLTSGNYVLALNSKGGIQYYIVDSTSLTNLLAYMFSDSFAESLNVDHLLGAHSSLLKSFVNPMQYISSLKFIPRSLSIPTGAIPLSFGWWDIGASVGATGIKVSRTYTIMFTVSLTIPKHPQASTRGTYLNLEPWSTYDLEFLPFGKIHLDSTALQGVSALTLDVTIDIATGMGYCEVNAGSYTIAVLNAPVLVPISISSLTQNIGGAISSVSSGVLGTIGAAMAGDITGAISSATSGIGNAISSMSPSISTLGSDGGTAGLEYKPQLDAKFLSIVDEDLDHHGRPLCQNKQLNTLSGFIMCRDADIIVEDCVMAEYDMIKEYLTEGFFYE